LAGRLLLVIGRRQRQRPGLSYHGAAMLIYVLLVGTDLSPIPSTRTEQLLDFAALTEGEAQRLHGKRVRALVELDSPAWEDGGFLGFECVPADANSPRSGSPRRMTPPTAWSWKGRCGRCGIFPRRTGCSLASRNIVWSVPGDYGSPYLPAPPYLWLGILICPSQQRVLLAEFPLFPLGFTPLPALSQGGQLLRGFWHIKLIGRPAKAIAMRVNHLAANLNRSR